MGYQIEIDEGRLAGLHVVTGRKQVGVRPAWTPCKPHIQARQPPYAPVVTARKQVGVRPAWTPCKPHIQARQPLPANGWGCALASPPPGPGL